jgi:hypothetical protein
MGDFLKISCFFHLFICKLLFFSKRLGNTFDFAGKVTMVKSNKAQ